MEFKSYDSVEEMFADIEKGVQQAKEAATTAQNAITKGDYWARSMPEWDLLIFGYIMTDDELYSSPAYEGVSQEEINYEKQNLARSYENGFRFGRAYSVIVPEGELGDTHVSTMTKISKEQFELAKSKNWDLSKPDDIMEFLSLEKDL